MPCVRFVIFGSNSDYARVGEWFDRVLCAKADFKDEIPDISSGCLNLPTNAYSKQLFGGVAGGSPRTAVHYVDNEFGQPVAPTQHSRCRSRTRCRTRTSAGSRPGGSPRTAVHYVNEHGQSVADSAQEVHYVNEHGQPVADPAQERCSTSTSTRPRTSPRSWMSTSRWPAGPAGLQDTLVYATSLNEH